MTQEIRQIAQPEEAINQLINQRFNQVLSHNVQGADQQWENICKEFNRIEESRTNKIPVSEFEMKYSKFFNPENMKILGSDISLESKRWREDSADFLSRIDPYQPFMVVSDADPDVVLKVFPPIFRRIDVLSPDEETGKQESSLVDENGKKMTVKEVTAMSTAIFSNFGADPDQNKRADAMTLMKQSLFVTQNRKKLLNDIMITNYIITHSDDPAVILEGASPSGAVENNDMPISAEDCGLMLDDDDD